LVRLFCRLGAATRKRTESDRKLLDSNRQGEHPSGTMALTLVVLSGNTSDQVPLTLDGPRIVVGRAENSDVRLPDYSVSLRHASFRQRGSDYLIVDEGSTNGTFVGPVKLSPQAPRVVRSGDCLRFGRIWVEVRSEPVPATAQFAVAAKELALRLVAEALAANGDSTLARIVIDHGPDAGTELTLELAERRYALGRANTCELVLTEPNCSRRHVEVFLRNSQVYARDLGSKNGTLLSGLPLRSKTETAWPSGATMQIGSDLVRLVDPVAEALCELSQGADEVLSPDEEVPIPSRRPADVAGTDQVKSRTLTASNKHSARRRSEQARSGVSRADLFVGLLALLVLGASLFGLFWLLGSH
jgi:pSer/pThr/pTyr-binding forkhead associated (FHA) protein